MNEAAAAIRSRQVKTHSWEAPNGEVFEARVPTSAQIMIFLSSLRDTENMGHWDGVQRFLKNTFKNEGDYERIYELMEEGVIDVPDIIGGSEAGEDGEGRPSLFAQLTEEASGGRPTQPSSDSSKRSEEDSGRRSTGRSPGKGSIRSNSPSTDS